ncbi:MAG: rhomboid family intramembrane serine protease [Hyphomonadaceae bacterium]
MLPPEILAAPATYALIAANVLISIAAFSSPRLIEGLMLYVRPILRGQGLHRVLTSGFVHGDPSHLFFNMLSLYFMGDFLERTVGTTSFLMIYFLSLLAGSGWAVMENVRNPEYRALGASGAVSGVVAATALFYPYAWLAFPPIPLLAYAALYIGWSAFAMGRVRDGIGHAAHLGGALMGVALVCLFWPSQLHALWRDLLSVFGVS